MTRDEIMKLAKEAGLILTAERETPGWSAPLPGATYPDRLERFAALVRAEVLEEAAGVCDEYDGSWYVHRKGAAECAAAIRIRALKGEKE